MIENIKIIIWIMLFIVLFSQISLAQEPPQEKIVLNEEQDLHIIEEISYSETVYNPYGDGHNESTYYMNTRPADFIQVVNTNGTIINEAYIYLRDKFNNLNNLLIK